MGSRILVVNWFGILIWSLLFMLFVEVKNCDCKVFYLFNKVIFCGKNVFLLEVREMFCVFWLKRCVFNCFLRFVIVWEIFDFGKFRSVVVVLKFFNFVVFINCVSILNLFIFCLLFIK